MNRASEASPVERRAEQGVKRTKTWNSRSGWVTRKRKGMSLLMMLILVPILLGLAISYIDPIIRSFRAAVNDQKTLLAKSVADSMFEVALWDSRGAGSGELIEGCIGDCADGFDYGFGTATGKWQVISTPEIDDEHLIDDGTGTNWYTVPAAGSGDAGGDYCSTAEPVINSNMLGLKLTELGIDPQPISNALDWPCHWNKIKEGESVVIPLYTEAADGTVRNPSDLRLDRFELRIRAACDPARILADDPGRDDPYLSQLCRDTQRYVVKGDADKPSTTVIVLWQIIGDEILSDGTETGKTIVLFPYNPDPFTNTNIINRYINNYANPANSLKQNSSTTDQDGCFENNIGEHINNNASLCEYEYINKPRLQLLVIHSLRDSVDPNRSIPYLEYQFKATEPVSGGGAVSSTSKVVRVDVMIDGGYSETLERTISIPKPISGFVIRQ